HDNPHFKMLYSLIQDNLEKDSLLFYYAQDERELREFIEDNFKEGNLLDRKILIDKNNFYFIYQKWLERVKPTISISWSDAKTMEILDVDFYLADLISDKDNSLLENLKVVLQHNKYKLKVGSNILGGLFQEHGFMDDQRAYKRFWNIYERPPKKEYWDYIIDRRDILVPQDFRERKGAFYTPQMWVELSQNYLARVLGEDWQEEYYIWDCAAGTGNLLNGLTEKYRIYASTLDSADVDVMKEKIKSGTSNLLEDHVFTFDFLNGDFSNLPSSLQDIINDKEKRKKLVIYINPPYAEATTAKTVAKTGSNKSKVATDNRTYRRYKKDLGKASNELFAQFLIRIYKEIPNCKIANFSTLKPLQSTNFEDFRNIFQAKLETLFIIPSKSFDNVSGNFPIGFFIWSTNIKRVFKTIQADVYNIRGKGRGYKKIYTKKDAKYINEWLQLLQEDSDAIGILDVRGNDFQNSKYCCIQKPNFERTSHSTLIPITAINVYPICIYFSARLCIEATWLNDRDQFLYPNNKWKKDKEFQRDCLIFTLFH
ncbi:MAG: N-6 DNA methylase, partial [Bacteroidota bacterium]|nr:N-6 DNA methylase [Bacteroidota bacterium]